jgi:hypothetical protein
VGALNNEEVGKYLNEYFVSSFQKVGTFTIVGNQKQGGNVASYFCAPDGRVLHVIAGPVDAAAFLHEAKWVVETTKKAIEESKGDGGKFKAIFRTAHAQRLRNEHGLIIEPVTYDPVIEQDPKSALTYNDPTGRPLAPVLTPVPINGPDVELAVKQVAEARAPGAKVLADKRGRRVAIGTSGQIHQLLAGHCMVKIEKIYASVFEGILGERVTTEPVHVVKPFGWEKDSPKVTLTR